MAPYFYDKKIRTTLGGRHIDIEYRTFWKLAFVFLPKKCAITKKIIWLEHAFKGSLGHKKHNGEYIILNTIWHRKKEHLFWHLKR